MSEGKVRIAAVGLGNRTCKYLSYVSEHRDIAEVVALVDPDASRMHGLRAGFSLSEDRCFSTFDELVASGLDVDACIIGTPDKFHHELTIKSLRAGWHVLLEKPMGQTEQQCREIAQTSIETGRMVTVCYVLRYHPYFMKLKELVDDPRVGRILSVRHVERVGRDRTAHTFVRGPWNMAEMNTTVFFTKCCHDVDFILWLTGGEVESVVSTSGTRIFTEKNAPEGAGKRCMDCQIEQTCPYSAVDLYLRRRDWIKGFAPYPGETQDDMLIRVLKESRYGRCVYHCPENDVIDRQSMTLQLTSGIKAEVTMECVTDEKDRLTIIDCEHAVISGDESTIEVSFRDPSAVPESHDFSWTRTQDFHAGADLLIIQEFLDAILSGSLQTRTPAHTSLQSHILCLSAEK
jgi:predicted dehydrogenase